MSVNALPRDYETFRQTVHDIQSGATQVRFLGSGSESRVFEAQVEDKKYAVKFAVRYTPLDRPRNTVAATQRKIDAGQRGLGIIGLEQIQAASPPEGVAIYNYIEGITVRSMTDKDLSQVTEAQVRSLYDTIDQAVEIGIEFDPWNQDGTNALYSPDTGFTLIDYFVDYAKTSPEESRQNGYKALGSTAVKLAKLFGEP